MSTISYLEAVVVGAMQGVTELFPVSSLGHSVIFPALIGGSWARDLDVSTPEFELKFPFADAPVVTVGGSTIPAKPLEYTIGTSPRG